MNKTLLKIFSTGAAVLFSASAFATPFTISSTLFGDPRIDGYATDLMIDVTVTGNTDSNVVRWTVNIDSLAHPNAKLDEFYFNVVTTSAYSFSNFSPTTWAVSTDVGVQGGGNFTPNFMFEAFDGENGNDRINVTNTVDLTFDMTKSSGGAFTLGDFLNASCSTSTAFPGCWQMGAHLQSLTVGRGIADSGFLVGIYGDDTRPPLEVPEPASLALLGLGMLALAVTRRRRG